MFAGVRSRLRRRRARSRALSLKAECSGSSASSAASPCARAIRVRPISSPGAVGCGAAAALVSTAGSGPALVAAGEHRWPESLEVMGSRVEDDGLGVLVSPHIPELTTSRLAAAVDGFLAQHNRTRDGVDAFAVHPGGSKVLAGFDALLRLPTAPASAQPRPPGGTGLGKPAA